MEPVSRECLVDFLKIWEEARTEAHAKYARETVERAVDFAKLDATYVEMCEEMWAGYRHGITPAAL